MDPRFGDEAAGFEGSRIAVQLAYVSQCDCVLVPVVLTPEVGNENEDLGRDAVDWGELVIPGPDQVEDLESITLESLNLRGRTRK